MMKKAVFTGPDQPLKVVEDVLPEVPSEGALIKTLYAGVCHTDVHLRKDDIDMGGGQKMCLSKTLGAKYLGTTFGHEICGEIVGFGEKADPASQGLKIGDKVCVYPWIGCTSCNECKIGMNQICEDDDLLTKDIGINPTINGGYATHVPVPQCRFLIKVPANLPLHIASMLPCSGATSFSALLKVAPQIQQAIKARGQANLLAIGAGGLGLWCIQLLKKAHLLGDKVKVMVADISEEKIQMAKKAGADGGFVWDREGQVEDLAKMTTKNGEGKMDAIINFVGSSKTNAVALKSLAKGGILVVIGLAGGTMEISTAAFLLSCETVAGSKTSSLGELRDLVKLVSEKGLEYPELHFITLNEVNDALDKLEAGTLSGRTIIKFD